MPGARKLLFSAGLTVLAATACSFTPAELPGAGGAIDANVPLPPDAIPTDIDAPTDAPTDIDAPPDAPIDAPIDAAPDIDAPGPDAGPGPCDPTLEVLIGCWAFEPPSTPNIAPDGSQYGNNASTNNPVTYAPGYDGSAIRLGVVTRVAVGDSPSLDEQNELSLEAWINPSSVPLASSARHATIVQKANQYGLFLYAGGQLECRTATGSVSGGFVTAGVWTHVACVFDSANLAISVFINGSFSATAPVTGPLPSGDAVLIIGGDSPCESAICSDPFDGYMDDLRFWKHARTPGQICTDAHGPGC